MVPNPIRRFIAAGSAAALVAVSLVLGATTAAADVPLPPAGEFFADQCAGTTDYDPEVADSRGGDYGQETCPI